MNIIDIHAHIFPTELERRATEFLCGYYDMPKKDNALVSNLLENAARINTSKIVVHTTATKPEQVPNINNFIASTIQTDERLLGFGTIHPDYSDIEGEIARIKSLGLMGIKLHPDFQAFDIDAPSMYNVYEAVGNTLPFLIHLGDKKSDHSSPLRMARVLDDFPFLRVIGAHLGGVFRWEEAISCLYGRNIYFDTSSAVRLLPADEALRLIRLHGVEKILFGTDFPLASHEEELALVQGLGLTDDELEQILSKNAEIFLEL